MAIHSSFLAWRIPWSVEPGVGYSPQGHKESNTTEASQHGMAQYVIQRSCSLLPALFPSTCKVRASNNWAFSGFFTRSKNIRRTSFPFLITLTPTQYIPTMFFKTTPLYLTLSNDSLKNLIILFPMFIVSKYFPYICFNFKSFSLRNYWV